MRTASVVAVDGVSLDVGEGECVGVVGESGCGKSTTGLSIMRLLPGNGHVTGGTISLLGRDLAGLDEKAMRRVRGNEVALIPQDPMTSLNPTMTIGRQISEGVRLHRDVSRQQARAAGPRGAPPGRDAPAGRAAGPVPPRAFRGTSPAGHDRHGPGLRAQAAHRRRAHHRARRHHSGPDPRPHRRPPAAAGHVGGTHHPRHGGHRRTHRPGRRHVCRQGGRGGGDRGAVQPHPPSVLRGPAGFGTQTGPAAATSGWLRSRACHRTCPRPSPTAGSPPVASTPPTSAGVEDPPLVDGRDGAGPVHRFACFHPVGLDNPVRTDAPDDESPDDQDPADRRGPEAAATSAGSPVEVSPPQVARAESLASAERILQVQDLVKEFPVMSGTLFRHQVGSVKAVSGLTFDIRKGETFGLVGESGCGKTTVGRLLVSLDRATAGSIRFEGVELSSLGASELRTRRRDLQLMFQDPYASLDPRMRVGTIIREPLKVNAVGDRASQDDKVGIAPRRGGSVQNLGGALPTRVLRWPTTAHRPGPGPGPRPQDHCGRRAGVGAGRVDPGPDPQPHEGSAGPPRPDLRDDLPRPGRRPLHGRHHRGHVPREDGRTGPGGRDLRPAGPPLHGGAAGGGAGDRRGLGPPPGPPGNEGQGRAAVIDQPAVGLPVPHPLPRRAGPLRRGGAAALRLRERPCGRLPLPAAAPTRSAAPR